MKNFKLKNLVAVALVAMTIATVSPIGASAEWKQDSNGWWNTKGNSWSQGWESIDGSWYYFGSDGYMKTNWVNDGGTWYFMKPSGAMATGWVNDGGTWYFTAPSGAMKTGWVNDGGTWYFTASSGAMQTGVVEVEGKVYYLAPSGAMATGNVVIGGVTYTFAASGEAIGDKIPTPTIKFTPAGIVVTPSKTPDKTDTTGTTGGSSGGGGGSSHNSHSSGYVALSQAVIDAQYQAATKITKSIQVSKSADGKTLIQPTFSFTPGTYTEYISATGKSYTVTKDVYVTLNGTDAYISGNYTDGYKVDGYNFDANGEDEVEITASISVYDNENGKLYYVTPAVTEIVPLSEQNSDK